MALSLPAVYADATVLIALARIGWLDLLALLPCPIRVTAIVWQEVAADLGRPGAVTLQEARSQNLLAVVDEGDPAPFPQLDAGEASVLAAAVAARAAVLVDERKARRVLDTDPACAAIPHSLGVVGLMLLAKRRGRIAELRPLVDALRQAGFRMSQALYQDALQAADEWPLS